MSSLHEAAGKGDLSLVKKLVGEDRTSVREQSWVGIDILLFYIFHLVMRD